MLLSFFVVKSEFPSIWCLGSLHNKNVYNLNNQHTFSVIKLIRQLVTYMLHSEPLGNAPRLHQFGRLENQLLPYKADVEINLAQFSM